jgi:hypothetical protein
MSDEERERNYNRIIDAIQFLKKDSRITEDWMEEHKQAIQYYRDMFSDWNMVNDEVNDKKFRHYAYTVEILLRFLTREIKVHKRFDKKIYLELNENLLSMINFLSEEDELTNQLSKLTM